VDLKNFILFVIFLVAISCTERKDYISDFSKSNIGEPLKNTRTFKIGLDDKSNYEIFSHQVWGSDLFESLYVLNKQQKTIDVYNIDDGYFIERIPLIVEGPNAISKPYGFYVLNRDSIYVFMQGSFKNTQLINSNGDLLGSFTPSNLDNFRFGLVNHSSVPSNPTYVKDNKVYFGMYGVFDTNDPSNFNEEVDLFGLFDLGTKSIEMNSNVGFPFTYLNKPWNVYHSFYSRVLNENMEWVVSWWGMDSVFRYDSNFKLLDKKLVKSSFSKKFTHGPKDESLKHAIEQGSYVRIIYDKYNNCYYRFLRHPREFDQLLDKNVQAFDRSNFSIIKLDSSLNFISETVFPGEQYNIYCAFITKKGLNIPKTNYWNKKLKEDFIEIDVYL